jgi:predicted DNA-binding protein YlxM (UPF0122 family)
LAEKQKDIYIRKHEEGMSYTEIAKEHGVSRQCVQQACTKKPHYQVKEQSCIFVNIRNWMNENHISKVMLSEMAEMSYAALDRYLKGVSDAPKRFIDKMIELTGICYETLFTIG